MPTKVAKKSPATQPATPRQKKRPATPLQNAAAQLVVRVRNRLGATRKVFSRMTGFSERAIADWEAGKPISEPGLLKVKELDRFQKHLAEVTDAAAIPAWLQTPNQAFDGLKPLEVIERGEIDRLWRMIYYLASGTPS